MGEFLGLPSGHRIIPSVRDGYCYRCGRVRSPDDVALGMANVGIDRCKRHVSGADRLRDYEAFQLAREV